MYCPLSKVLCTLLELLPHYFNYQTPADLNSPNELRDGDKYDFIVVGAGPAGSVIANRLSEISTWKVLLLEAGGDEPPLADIPAHQSLTLGTRLTWNYTTVPDKSICAGEPCLWETGRGLGGGSLHNNMVFNRGNKYTFDEWESMGNKGWGYKDILPYFKLWEDNQDPSIAKDTKYHSTKGAQPVGVFPYKDQNIKLLMRAYEDIGYGNADVNGPNQTGISFLQHFQKDGARYTANRAFLQSIKDERPNLTIVTNVRVTKVIINSKTSTAEGIEYAWENNRSIKGKIYANKEVIVSAGAFASPQLLMLSGIGPKETLKPLGIKVIQDLKVGHNFQNHIQSGSLNLKLPETRKAIPTDEGILNDLLNYLTTHSGPLATESGFDIAVYTSSRYAKPNVPDIQMYFFPRIYYKSDNETKLFVGPMCYYNELSAYHFVELPTSRGFVTINSTDPFAYPLIVPNYFKNDDQDMNVIIDGYNFMLKTLSNSKTLKEKGIVLDTTPIEGCKQHKFASDDYWKCHLSFNKEAAHHFSSTCKMGPASDKTAVVDPELRVHRVKRLRVADASIQPTVINGNTEGIALTVGEKVADFIKKTYGKKTVLL